MVEVFLSSTSKDLHECRQSVYRAIEGLRGFHCVRMEDFGAWDKTPSDVCQNYVVACDLFVILAGPLYGTMSPADVSYTQREYEIARDAEKPRLVFLSADDFAIPANIAETKRSRRLQDQFRKQLGNEHALKWFKTCSELSTMVVQAIRNWEASPTQHSVVHIRRNGASMREAAIEIRRPFLRFGRSPECDVIIADDHNVSWEHSMIFKHDGQFYCRHLSHTNATRLTTDGHTVTLRPGDECEVLLGPKTEVRIGDTDLTVSILLAYENPKIMSTNKQIDLL